MCYFSVASATTLLIGIFGLCAIKYDCKEFLIVSRPYVMAHFSFGRFKCLALIGQDGPTPGKIRNLRQTWQNSAKLTINYLGIYNHSTYRCDTTWSYLIWNVLCWRRL